MSSSNERPTLYLIDGSGYIFRAYYAVRPLSTSTGTPTNAVTGFAKMLLKLVREHAPGLLGIAFDPPGKSHRHSIYADYKANREAPPEDLVPQFPLIHELVECMDIPVLVHDGYEADDILATLARQGVEQGYRVMVVSGDKDLLQLVSENVTMYDPLKDKIYDEAAVVDKLGVPPSQVADLLALAGDKSDNIPGVPKVGPKSAAKLLQQFGDLESMLAGVATLSKPKAFERSLLENRQTARLSRQLTGLETHMPIALDPARLRYRAPEGPHIVAFFKRIEAFGLMRDFELRAGDKQTAAAAPDGTAADAGEPAPQAPPRIDPSRYRTIADADALAELIAHIRSTKRLSVDLETTSLDPNRAEIVGFALALPNATPCYVPVGHRGLGVAPQLDRAWVLEQLRPVLQAPDVAKIGQNLKYDWVVLARHGVTLAGIAEDTMLAAYVLDPARASFSLDSLAREILGHDTIKYEDVAGRGRKQVPFAEIPVDMATRYAAEDADVALQLSEQLVPRVREASLSRLLFEVEVPLVPVLARMEYHGIQVDEAALHRLSAEFSERLSELEQRVEQRIGEPINLASPKQLATLFFEKLGYAPVKKTKTGYSTDHSVLEALAREHDLPKLVLQHRTLAKLKSTYVEALLKMINPLTGRVHTSFNQTGAATGRLSSSDPNLQNIPIRTEDGRRLREVFVAAPGHTLIAADYSQIELRVMAHLSGDAHFLEAFRQGEDIHARTAREILTNGQPPDTEMRRRAKAINFGILYGLSEFGLAKQLEIPRAEARAYIQAYFGRYPKIRQFLDDTIETARSRGYVSTLAGRRRFLPELQSKNTTARQGAERIAMNTPIQGSAADLIKMAMLRVDAALRTRELQARLLLQVHDELVVEAPHAEKAEVETLLREEMANVMTLSVPLEVEVGSGHNWAEAH